MMEVQHTSGGPGHVLGLGCWCQPIAYTVGGPYTRVVATEEDAVRMNGILSVPYIILVSTPRERR